MYKKALIYCTTLSAYALECAGNNMDSNACDIFNNLWVDIGIKERHLQVEDAVDDGPCLSHIIEAAGRYIEYIEHESEEDNSNEGSFSLLQDILGGRLQQLYADR